MLTRIQRINVHKIIAQTKAMRLGPRAAVIATATALAESNLLNYANVHVPESLKLPHDVVGSDHASLGIMQQQTGTEWTVPVAETTMRSKNGWGTPPELMSPANATHLFLTAMLEKYPYGEWRTMDRGAVCQGVQVSAYPDAYNRRMREAHLAVWAYWYFV